MLGNGRTWIRLLTSVWPSVHIVDCRVPSNKIIFPLEASECDLPFPRTAFSTTLCLATSAHASGLSRIVASLGKHSLTNPKFSTRSLSVTSRHTHCFPHPSFLELITTLNCLYFCYSTIMLPSQLDSQIA